MSMANVLTGDVGGTSTRLGIFELRTPRPALVATRTYGTRDFASIETMTVAFLRDVGVTPSSLSAACFGVAGPVIGDAATLTNAPVRLDARAIATSVGLARVALLNDLEALAYAVPVLSAEELLVLQDGRADPSGPIALIAAGTGLGEAMLHRIGERVVAKASEGGRADFAARTERDIKVLRALTRECGRAAVEHVVSGPGLVNIHKALHPEGCAARIDMTAAPPRARLPTPPPRAHAQRASIRWSCLSRRTAPRQEIWPSAPSRQVACTSAAASRQRFEVGCKPEASWRRFVPRLRSHRCSNRFP